MNKLWLGSLALVSMIGLGPAVAQNINLPELRELDEDAPARLNGLTVDDIEDIDVYTERDERVGDVEEVLGNAAGEIVALVVEIDEFWKLGDREVVVGIDQLQLVTGDKRRFTTSLTEEQLKALPDWKD